MLRLKTMVSILGLLVIMGCSKDEPEDNLLKENQVKTGVFLDSAVEGLYYETSTRNGLTNSKGEFKYLEGERITFFLGDFELGSNLAEAIMTPISIARTPKADIYSTEVQYMAALLQTLDIDGDPGNGIKLVPEVLNAIELNNMNLKQPERNMFLGIVKNVKEKTGIELNEVYPEQAAAHLAETLGENYQLYASLLPILESTVNPFEPVTSVSWEHQFNDEGRLVKSIRYENNPYRISAEYVYTEYLEDGYPIKMEITKNKLGEPVFSISKEILYNDDRKAIGLKNFDIKGEVISITEFVGLNDQGMVMESKTFDPSGEFLYREIFDRNENGNVELHSRYSSETSTEIEDLEVRYEFTHTEYGELLMSKQLRPYKRNIKSDYIYRADNTLKQKNTLTLVLDQNRMYSREDFYNEQEEIIQINITQGDWRSEYVEFYPNGDYKLVNTYYQEWLQEIATFDEDGYAELKIWDLDRSGSFQIDFRDPDWNLLKTEYYNDEGTYLRTEYYENNTLVTTEYA